jgi:hypothetical protein
MLRIDRPASRILKIQLAWAQRVAGVQDPLLANPTAPIPHLNEELWITTFREFLRESELSIFIPSIKFRPVKCVHDQFIIEIASFLNYSRASMFRLNRCRIYLKAETLADIVTYNGLHIDINAFECNSKGVITSPEKWPIQPRPGTKHIQLWKSFLRKICHIDSLTLDQPLKEWLYQPPIRSKCSCFYDTTANKIYIKQSDEWHYTVPVQKRRYTESTYTIKFPSDSEVDITNMIPTDMKEENHGRKTFQWRQITSPTIPIQPDATTFQAFISHLPAWEQKLLRIFEFLLPIEEIIDIFNNETKEVYIVSDGGCSANLRSFGWIISNQSMHLAQGQGVVPGGPMSSHRAEGFVKLA